ncbi:MAG: DUF5676 family membrane protein [Nanoarchaeota archaeon]|nr:DUF5676 family membrane protein [Nanoarchaeota archaeon]
MAEKLNEKKVAFSLAIVAGIVYIVCAILVAIAPAWTVNTFGALFHGIDISQIAKESVSLGNTITGLVEIVVLALIVGWLFAKIYNSMN